VVALCAVLALIARPGSARADGILEGISGDLETTYSHVSSASTDRAGGTTRTETDGYGPRLNLRLNYNLLPKLNLNAGVAYERTFADQSGDGNDVSTDSSRLRPSILLSLRDPILGGAAGYDRREETFRTSGLPAFTLTRSPFGVTAPFSNVTVTV